VPLVLHERRARQEIELFSRSPGNAGAQGIEQRQELGDGDGHPTFTQREEESY